MKISKSRFEQIISEELDNYIKENEGKVEEAAPVVAPVIKTVGKKIIVSILVSQLEKLLQKIFEDSLEKVRDEGNLEPGEGNFVDLAKKVTYDVVVDKLNEFLNGVGSEQGNEGQ